eukprot:62059-Chlamydomonas_euryale.AAC.1
MPASARSALTLLAKYSLLTVATGLATGAVTCRSLCWVCPLSRLRALSSGPASWPGGGARTKPPTWIS